jgi:uncharacterized protein (TIGR00725 family)
MRQHIEKSKPGKAPRLIIAVTGGGRCSPGEAADAEAVGRELAKSGVTLICGGLGGVMEAACRGASTENGITVGILPTDDTSTANRFVQIPVATGLGQARNIAVVRSAHAVIAIGGEYGTLSEIAFALKSKTPVVGLNTWSLRRNQKDDTAITIAKNPADAVKKAVSLAKKNNRKKDEIRKIHY